MRGILVGPRYFLSGPTKLLSLQKERRGRQKWELKKRDTNTLRRFSQVKDES